MFSAPPLLGITTNRPQGARSGARLAKADFAVEARRVSSSVPRLGQAGDIAILVAVGTSGVNGIEVADPGRARTVVEPRGSAAGPLVRSSGGVPRGGQVGDMAELIAVAARVIDIEEADPGRARPVVEPGGKPPATSPRRIARPESPRPPGNVPRVGQVGDIAPMEAVAAAGVVDIK